MSDRPNMDELEALDRAHLFHPSTHMKSHARGESTSRIVEGGEGVYVVDRNGTWRLDGFAGLYCVNIGYGRREVVDAIAEQAAKLPYYHAYAGHGSEPAIRLAKRVIDLAPPGMARVYFGLSGSDANETNIKLVWYYNNVLGRPRKKKIISRERGYHGSGVMTGSLTGLPLFHKAFDLPRAPILHTHCPHYWKNAPPGMTEEEYAAWCADELERLILEEDPDTVAAFVAEPIMGTGGMIAPPAGYWPKVQAILEKYSVLLVADEVVTGFGRLGTWFGSEFYRMRPDLITVAKGLTSAYLPLSASIVSDRMWEVLEEGSERLGVLGHGWTYSAHPLCAAAGLANLDVLDKENVLENVRKVGAYMQTGLREAFNGHPMVGEVRGAGLLAAIEFVADRDDRKPFPPEEKIGQRVSEACLANGLIARAMPHGDILGFAPPLVISLAEVDSLIDMTRGAIEAVFREIRSVA